MTDHIEVNRRLWNSWAKINAASDFYDVEGFKAGRDPIDEIVSELVGDVDGKRLLHLQCHFGLDTLGFARRGARVTGVDFSTEAIATARRLAEETGLAATFELAEIASLPGRFAGEFDIVFTSYGAIQWLPDLEAWADTIAQALAPGGAFCIAEAHPAAAVFDDEREDTLAVRYSYFDTEPQHFVEHGSYADRDADFEGDSYGWQHPLEEILGVLLSRGLRIESFGEYDRVPWQWFPMLVERGGGFWGMPEDGPQLPLLFTLRASKEAR